MNVNLKNEEYDVHAVLNFGDVEVRVCGLTGCTGGTRVAVTSAEELVLSFNDALIPSAKLMWAIAADTGTVALDSGFLDVDVAPGTWTIDPCAPIYDPILGNIQDPECHNKQPYDKFGDGVHANFKGWAAVDCADFSYLFDRRGVSYNPCYVAGPTFGTLGPGAAVTYVQSQMKVLELGI